MVKNILAFDLSPTGIRASISNGGIITKDYSYAFTSALDYKIKEQLKEFVEENGLKQLEVDDIALSWSHPHSALLPMNVFNDSDKESIYTLSFGELETGVTTDYNRLPQHGIVNVYAVSDWLKSFFVMNFPRVIMQHEGTLLIRQLFAHSSVRPKAIVSIHQNHFLLAITQNNDLKFYNYFEYTNAEDMIYYIGFAMQQMQISPADVELILNASQGCELDLQLVKTYYSQLNQPRTEVQVVEHYLTKAIELCV